MHTNMAGYMINVNSIASSALSLQLSRGVITQWVERPTEKPGAMLTQVRFPGAGDFSPMEMLTRVRFPDAAKDFSPMVMLTRVRFPDAARDFCLTVFVPHPLPVRNRMHQPVCAR